MSEKYRVAVLVGSLRAQSINRMVAETFGSLVPEMEFRFLNFGALPMMNEDIEDSPPSEWVGFRKEIAVADAFLFVTPEYNRSIPGAFKNALDVGSRPYGKNLWNGKPAAVLSASIGQIGGFGANHHLRQVLTYLNVHVMDQPEVYLSQAANLFDADGTMKDSATYDFLKSVGRAFLEWTELHRRGIEYV